MVQLFNQLLFIHHQAFKDLKRSLQKKIKIEQLRGETS